MNNMQAAAIKWLLGILQVVALGLMSWALLQIGDQNVRITRIEANRFTSLDAVRFLRENVPPKEVTMRLDRLEAAVLRIEDKLESHRP